MLSTILKRDHARHHGKWPLRHLCIRGQHISQKVGPPMDFCHNPLRRGRKWTKSKGFIFFFFFLKNWSEARRFFFFSLYIYLTCSEMSSLSKLTLEPFCLTNSPQSSQWKSLSPQGLFFHVVTYHLSSLTLQDKKPPAPVVTKLVRLDSL